MLGGGPCVFNPEPYAPFFDAMLIGEGEESLPEALLCVRECRRAGATRQDILRSLAVLPGCYVPSLYRVRGEEEAQRAGSWVEPLEPGVPEHIEKRLFSGFSESSGWEPCIVPYTECVHDRLSVEVLRGCARGCRFCQAGMMYRPVRERSADNVVSSVLEGLADTGYDEVSLTSLSSTDHSQIADILTKLNHACDGKGVRISLPSQRLDSFGVDMAELVAGQKKGGLTFAPEAGTQRLRDVINKNVTEDDLFGAIDAAFKAGWRRCKLYFMIGLPTETDEDIKGIASLVQRAYDRAKAAVPPEHRGNVRVRAAGGRLGGGRMAPRGTLRCVDRALLGGRLAEGCVRRGNRSCGNRAGAVGYLARHAVGAYFHGRDHALPGARAQACGGGDHHTRLHLREVHGLRCVPGARLRQYASWRSLHAERACRRGWRGRGGCDACSGCAGRGRRCARVRDCSCGGRSCRRARICCGFSCCCRGIGKR